MRNPLVSWLMPVYNSEKTLSRAMDSMLCQTYRNLEVVVVLEDNCTDRSFEICEVYASKDKRVRLYRNGENLGIARSLNRGLGLCSGKYIARMDADDVSHPDRLEKQVGFMETHPEVGILGSGCLVIGEKDTYIAKYPEKNRDIRAKLLFGTAFAHPTVMMNGDLFRRNNWKYPIDEAEDYALWAELITKTEMACLPEALVDYCLHEEQSISRKFTSVRMASAEISKKTIKRELSVEIDNYSYTYFGWRGMDLIPSDTKKYLADGAALLREIKRANNVRNVFDKNALCQVLREQWEITKRSARVSSFSLDFNEENPEKISCAFDEYKAILSKKRKVIIYGTGKYATESLGDENNLNLFDIVAFSDSDIKKHGAKFFGKEIIPPDMMSHISYDYILIASPIYEDEIRGLLVSRFLIPHEKILTLPSADDLSLYRDCVKNGLEWVC
ncbi:MAG: glycosyltransferase [Prevotellaceae bacterium]|jgi:glycosyltransferase involved in cell wall biosynthesis|nr:glycosyltransferase [Prevotellaceae bacterium]